MKTEQQNKFAHSFARLGLVLTLLILFPGITPTRADRTQGELDLGDAPDRFYQTLLSSGASHVLGSGVYLGTCVDAELDGQPSAGADGDDTNIAGIDEALGLGGVAGEGLNGTGQQLRNRLAAAIEGDIFDRPDIVDTRLFGCKQNLQMVPAAARIRRGDTFGIFWLECETDAREGEAGEKGSAACRNQFIHDESSLIPVALILCEGPETVRQ